jgi:hypothetical protein
VGVVTVVPATPPITVQNFRTTPASLEALCGVGGPAGNRNLITRSILRSNTSGVFIDAAALCVNNRSLLRDFIRPALTTRFGLTTGGFNATHPFQWAGSVPLPIPSIPLVSSASLLSMTAGVDEVQRLHVLGSAIAAGSAGAFSVTIRFDLAVTVAASTDGVTLTITPTLAGTPTVNSDISIAWWVYVGGILAGGIGLTAVLAAIDLFGGLFLNGPISSAIAGAVAGALPAIPVPISGPGLPRIVSAVSSVSLNQADAAAQTFTLPGTTLTVPDGFRQHDLIVTMT